MQPLYLIFMECLSPEPASKANSHVCFMGFLSSLSCPRTLLSNGDESRADQEERRAEAHVYPCAL